MEFSAKERKYLFSLARQAIAAHFTGTRFYPQFIAGKTAEKLGVFVTLKEGGELRGCIGYPLPIAPLAQAVAENAVNAAFRDPRFRPLEKYELSALEIEITVLTVPQELDFKSPKELETKVKIGRDGLLLEYAGFAGLLLPQVPVEEKWDSKTFLSHLCLKAGLEPDTWLKKPVRIKRFEGVVLREGE